MKIAALLVLAAAFAAQAQTNAHAALGKELTAELEKRYKPLDDSVVSAYVNTLGGRISSAAGLTAPLTIRLVSTEDTVAAAFPGGYLVLSSGMIRRAENESELAGMLAHQIAHIAARHGAGIPARAGSGTVPLVFLGGTNGICARFSERLLLPVGLRQTSLKREAEADALAREYLDKLQYDPLGLGEVFRKLGSK